MSDCGQTVVAEKSTTLRAKYELTPSNDKAAMLEKDIKEKLVEVHNMKLKIAEAYIELRKAENDVAKLQDIWMNVCKLCHGTGVIKHPKHMFRENREHKNVLCPQCRGEMIVFHDAQ